MKKKPLLKGQEEQLWFDNSHETNGDKLIQINAEDIPDRKGCQLSGYEIAFEGGLN